MLPHSGRRCGAGLFDGAWKRKEPRPDRDAALAKGGVLGKDQTSRSTIIFLISAMALAGLRFFGQVLAQFMIVWQR